MRYLNDTAFFNGSLLVGTYGSGEVGHGNFKMFELKARPLLRFTGPRVQNRE